MLTTKSQTFPLPSQQSIEVDFIENHHVELERVGVERTCTFDVERQKFVTQTVVSELTFDDASEPVNVLELQRTQDLLCSAIAKLKEAKGKKCDKIAKFNLADAHCWNDVVRIVTEAEEAYLKDDCPSGKIRKAFRRLGDNAKSIKPFIGLLPEGSYKTLCGGLTLILTAMMKKAELREKMADILDELPLTIQECEDYCQIYKGKNSLRVRIEELYIQLVGAISDMIRWYTQKSLSRSAKSLFKNDAYSDSIDRRLKEIQRAKLAFDKEATKYLHWRTDMINRTAQETNENVKLIGTKIWDNSHQLHNVEKAIEAQARMVNGVYDVLRDHSLNAEWLEDKRVYQQRVKDQDEVIKDLQTKLEKKNFRSKTLAHRLRLNLSTDTCATNVDLALSTGTTSRLRFQARSKQIAEDEEFRTWFTGSEASLLCVNGNYEQNALAPTSFLAALLIQTLEKQNVLVLRFFCGLHTSPITLGEHEIGGPSLLLRSMFAQILSIEDIDKKHHLSILDEDHVQAMEDASFQQYLDTFSALLETLLEDYNGIVVIIDGIEFYDMQWRKRTKKLIKRLSELTGNASSVGGSLKVLLMAASHSSLFRKIHGASMLEIPEDLEDEGSGFESLGEF